MMSTPHKPRAAGHRWLAAVASAACMTTGIALAADSVTFTAGSPGGGYFKAAAAFGEYIKSDIPGTSVTVIPGGGWANVERLDQASKAADVAVLENALASMAYEGTGPTARSTTSECWPRFASRGAAQALVLDSAEIGSFEELNEKKPPIRITMFERHQLATGQALAVLEAYGITADDVNSWGGKIIFTSIGEAMRMLADGQADMWFTGGSYFPHPQYIKLGARARSSCCPSARKSPVRSARSSDRTSWKCPPGSTPTTMGRTPSTGRRPRF